MKYISADKLIAKIVELRKELPNTIEHLNDEESGFARGQQYELTAIEAEILCLQQEQPETPSGEEVMTMCNQILIDWVKEGKTPEEREQREQAHIRFFELYDEYMQEQPEVPSNLIDCDAVRDNFIAEVYRVLDADPTNDRANAIIDAFDSLPTVPQQPEVALEKGETINTEILLGENGKPYIHSFEVYDYNKNIPLFLPGTEVTLQIRKVEQNG